jgi:hypothetical protein
MLYVNFRVYSSGLRAGDAAAAWYDEREREGYGDRNRGAHHDTEQHGKRMHLSSRPSF